MVNNGQQLFKEITTLFSLAVYQQNRYKINRFGARVRVGPIWEKQKPNKILFGARARVKSQGFTYNSYMGKSLKRKNIS